MTETSADMMTESLPEHTPVPKDDTQTVELDPPTVFALTELLDVALQDGVLGEETHEKAALARLLSKLHTENAEPGELPDSVEDNTVMGGIAGAIYQGDLFDYYEEETGVAPPESEDN